MKDYLALIRYPVPQIFLVLMLLLTGGCGRGHSGPPATYVYVIDYSGSTSKVRSRQLGQVLAELETAPGGSNVVVYRMASQTEEIYSGPLDGSALDSVAIEVKRDVTDSDSTKGTNFAKMAGALASFSKRFGGKRYLVRILTDGGDDFASDPRNGASYRVSADTVCRDPRLNSLVFYGVHPGFREQLRHVWQKAGARLQILSQHQMLAE